MRKTRRSLFLALVLVLVLAPAAFAAELSFSDPTGDDNGPGGYIYPTDAVYTAGSFDMTELRVKASGSRADVAVSFASNLDDPWGMGVGFATQMVFVFIDNAEGGHTETIPGLNVQFAEDSAWDKVIVLSPQQKGRVLQEIEAKAGDLAADIVVPTRTTGSGNTITAKVRMKDLGEGDPATWGWQAVVQSNEGFPAEGELLTRRVNEFEGQHRFGGGTDYACDPHVMDILGDDQAEQLKYECNSDGSAKAMATLHHIKK